MSMLQEYERALTHYDEMIKTISKIEEESVVAAYELQKEMLRVTEIYAQNEDLKKIFDCIQFKEDITNNTSSEPFNPVVVPENKHDSLTESLNSARMLLRETSNELKNFVQNEDETE